MDCLFELIFETLFEVMFEGWLYLMQLIVPEKGLNSRVINALKVFVCIFAVILFVSMFMGLLALISDDEYTIFIGKFMVFIPLGISVVQIISGIIVRCTVKKRQ